MKSLIPKIKKADAARDAIGNKIVKTKHKEAHSANVKYGMGDNYGTGVRQPFGKMRDDSMGMRPVNKKKMKNVPRSLA